MSYNPQQSQSQEQSGSGSGYSNASSPQHLNQPYSNLASQPPPITPPYNAPFNSKKASAVSPALVVGGGGVVLLAVFALVAFLVLNSGAKPNPTTTSSSSSNANKGSGSTSDLLPESGVAKPASDGTGSSSSNSTTTTASSSGNGGTFKNTVSGKVGETLKLDDYSVTVYETKWVDITPNTEIIMSDEVGRYRTKPEDADFCLDWAIQRTGNNGYASRSPDGIATSGTYILSTATQTSEKVGKDRKIFGPFQSSNGLKPAFATKYRMEMQEVSRGWNCFVAPKSLATEPDFTFTYQTVTYPIQGQGLSATRVPFIFKFKLA